MLFFWRIILACFLFPTIVFAQLEVVVPTGRIIAGVPFPLKWTGGPGGQCDVFVVEPGGTETQFPRIAIIDTAVGDITVSISSAGDVELIAKSVADQTIVYRSPILRVTPEDPPASSTSPPGSSTPTPTPPTSSSAPSKTHTNTVTVTTTDRPQDFATTYDTSQLSDSITSTQTSQETTAAPSTSLDNHLLPAGSLSVTVTETETEMNQPSLSETSATTSQTPGPGTLAIVTKKRLPVASVVGIVIGAVVLVAAVVFLVSIVRQRRWRQRILLLPDPTIPRPYSEKYENAVDNHLSHPPPESSPATPVPNDLAPSFPAPFMQQTKYRLSRPSTAGSELFTARQRELRQKAQLAESRIAALESCPQDQLVRAAPEDLAVEIGRLRTELQWSRDHLRSSWALERSDERPPAYVA